MPVPPASIVISVPAFARSMPVLICMSFAAVSIPVPVCIRPLSVLVMVPVPRARQVSISSPVLMLTLRPVLVSVTLLDTVWL